MKFIYMLRRLRRYFVYLFKLQTFLTVLDTFRRALLGQSALYGY